VVRLLAVCLVAAGCTDVFQLPFDGGANGDGIITVADGADLAGADFAGEDLAGADFASGVLPASCARLPCVPAVNEGDVTLQGDSPVTGCHAYGTLTISQVQRAQGDEASNTGFSACADTIVVSGLLTADASGYDENMGPGTGGTCGSGGSHGGIGADPLGCGTGAAYDDPNAPRQLGSGGGGIGGGRGGGAIELQATTITFAPVVGVVSAIGAPGTGVSAGGGSGGSILLQADTILGAGQITAGGGLGTGFGGGGGGGGRVAIYSGAATSLSVNVSGGSTMAGGGDGTAGTYVHSP
jgi:hypothetical protein